MQAESDQLPHDEEQKKSSLIHTVIMEVLLCSDKDKLMAEFFSKDDEKEHREISQDAKNIVERQRNLAAPEILMLTAAVQFKSCCHDGTPRHTYCKCVIVFLGASDQLNKQVLTNVINCFNILTTRAVFFFNKRVQRENN